MDQWGVVEHHLVAGEGGRIRCWPSCWVLRPEPELCERVRIARVVLELGNLCGALWRVGGGRGLRTELVCRRQHPWLPCSDCRADDRGRIGGEEARSRRHRRRIEHRVRTVGP